MEIITYSKFRQNLKSFLDLVLKNRAPLFVTRTKGEDIVVMPKSDYESLQETLFLLSSPKNAERLAIGIKEYNDGKAVQRDLLD